MSKIFIFCPFSSRFRPFAEHHHPTQPHFHNCFKRQRGGWRASLNAGSFSCDQAALWMVQSVRPSIHLSVCCHTLFTLFPLSFHQSLMWLREVPYCCLRSSIKLQGHARRKSSILTQIERFWTANPVWIHQWLQKAWSRIEEVPYSISKSSIKFKVIRDRKSPLLTRIERFRTVTTVWIHQWLWNDTYNLAPY